MNRFTAIAGIAGALIVAAGAALIYRPLGLIAIGSALLAVAFASASRKRAN